MMTLAVQKEKNRRLEVLRELISTILFKIMMNFTLNYLHVMNCKAIFVVAKVRFTYLAIHKEIFYCKPKIYVPYVPPILGQLLDLLYLARTNLFGPRLESYNPYDMAN